MEGGEALQNSRGSHEQSGPHRAHLLAWHKQLLSSWSLIWVLGHKWGFLHSNVFLDGHVQSIHPTRYSFHNQKVPSQPHIRQLGQNRSLHSKGDGFCLSAFCCDRIWVRVLDVMTNLSKKKTKEQKITNDEQT